MDAWRTQGFFSEEQPALVRRVATLDPTAAATTAQSASDELLADFDDDNDDDDVHGAASGTHWVLSTGVNFLAA